MHKVGIIADDLTGSCDTGAKFASQETKVRVFIKPESSTFNNFLPVINTQSRFLSGEDAYEKAFRAAILLKQSNISIAFKKIDTMFRGNIGPEIEAVMKALNLEMALVVPAIPQMGRATIDGYQLIDGVSVEKFLPSSKSHNYHLPTFLADECSLKVGHISLTLVKRGSIGQAVQELYREENRVISIDAEKQEEIEQIIKATMNLDFPALLVGSLGLAEALSRNIFSSSPALNSFFSRKKGAILIISASSNSATQKQFEHIERTGHLELITIIPQEIINPAYAKTEEMIRDKIEEALRKERDIALKTSIKGFDSKVSNGEKGKLVMDRLTSIASSIIASARVGGLILIGGETSYNLCKKIGADTIDVFGEVESGTAYGTISAGQYKGMPLIIKGGSVGDRDSLIRSLRYLQGKE